MKGSARLALLLVALFLTLCAIALDVFGATTRDWTQLALPAVVAVILVFLLIREVKVS